MIELLSGLPDWMKVFVSAMVPVFELRFSMPFGVLGLKMSYGITYVISVLGSVVPAPFIMAFIPAILVWMRKTAPFKGLGNWVYNKSMSKRESIQKYGYIGLMFFVAI